MRLIWSVEKLASSIPHSTARRASRFFSLRLFFESESEPSLSRKSDAVVAVGSLRPRERKWRFRLEEGLAVKENRRVLVSVASTDGERRR